MNCNTTHYRANSSSVPGDPTVEDPYSLPLAAIVESVSRHSDVATAEIVGLTPRAALEGFPAELEIRGFDPARQIIENHLD